MGSAFTIPVRIWRCRFAISNLCASGAARSSTINSRTRFFCLQQDWLDGKNSTGARTALASNKSRDWGVTARVRAVEDGLRDLGQQTLELVMIVPQPVESATAETQFAELLPELVKVEELKK